MRLQQIRTDLAQLIADNVDGLLGCGEYAPDILVDGPFAFLGDAFGPVKMGAVEMWTYNIPLTIAVARKADYNSERVAVSEFVETTMQAIAADYTLGNTTMGLSVVEFREGVVDIGGEKFVGFTLFLRIKDVRGRELT